MNLPAADGCSGPALVWDWPLRVFHGAQVLAIAGSFATHYAGIEWFVWHRRCGYVVLVLIAFRVAWGFVGPRYARFASFLHRPTAVLDYLRGRQPYPAAGHNPLGGLSVVAFLLLLAVQAGSGLFANDEIANAGPFYGWITPQTSTRLSSVHALSSQGILGLIVLHLAAVAWYQFVRRQDLLRAFWTGHKAGAQGIDSSHGRRAVLIVLALIVALALALRAAPEATLSFF